MFIQHTSIKYLIYFSFLWMAPVMGDQPTTQKADTLGHRALDQDEALIPMIVGAYTPEKNPPKASEVVFGNKKLTQWIELSRARLDRILNEAAKRIGTQDRYSREDATKILQTIDKIIAEAGVKIGENPSPMSLEFPNQVWDCDARSIVYESIGERLNLPIKMIRYRDHLLVRWIFPDGNHLNWETRSDIPTINRVGEVPDEKYMSLLKIETQSVERKFYGTPLTDGEVLSLVMIPLLSKYQEMNVPVGPEHRDELKAIYKRVISDSNRTNFSAMGLLAKIEMNEGAFEEATKIYKEILEKDPRHQFATAGLGEIEFAKGNVDAGFDYFKKAIELNPDTIFADHLRRLLADQNKTKK